MNCNCPSCKSENTQSVPLAYKAGVTSHSGTITGATMGTSGFSTGTGVYSGTGQTHLARTLAPPEKQSDIVQPLVSYVVVRVIASFVGLPIIYVLATVFNLRSVTEAIDSHSAWLRYMTHVADFGWLALCVLMAATAHKFNKYELPALRHAWSNGYICLRCGMQFVPNS